MKQETSNHFPAHVVILCDPESPTLKRFDLCENTDGCQVASFETRDECKAYAAENGYDIQCWI